MRATAAIHAMAVSFGVATALLCAPLRACSVPVFRYALERWNADPYVVTLFHRGELSAGQRAQVERLRSLGAGHAANVRWRLVDVESAADFDGRMRELLESQRLPELPWLVVQSPATRMEVWSGKLTSLAEERLFDSPMRQEIARRLLAGQTAVWVLLEGVSHPTEENADDRTRGEEALALLKRSLAEEQANLKLSEIEEVDIQQGLVGIDPGELKITFSVLRLSREDARERALREMLLVTEEDLGDFQQPIAFPVFGRGRVLYALVGKGINAENIHAACVELTGPCTCQIKAQNLGADLLMSVDWDRLVRITDDFEKPLPPLAGLAGLGGPLEERDNPPELVVGIGQPSEPSGTTANAVAPVAVCRVPAEALPPEAPSLGMDGVATESSAPRSWLRESGISPLLLGMLVLFGLGMIGIVLASLRIIGR